MIQVNSFISNSKKEKVFYILKILIFFLLVYVTNRLMTFLLYDDTEAISRVSIHDMYLDQNIEAIVLGTSISRDAFDPFILEEELGDNTFNMSSNTQTIDGSLALLKEANRNGSVKRVYLSLFYRNIGDEPLKRPESISIQIVSDYMKPSLNKMNYMLHSCTPELWVTLLVPSQRYISDLFENKMFVPNLIKKKSDYNYSNYVYPQNDIFEYRGKGFTCYYDGADPVFFSDDTTVYHSEDYRISDYMLKTIKKIADYCDKNSIELVVVNLPLSDYFLMHWDDYDDYLSNLESALSQNGIKLYDFNLLKNDYFLSDGTRYVDTIHMSSIGAEEFSNTLAELCSGNVSEDELFYGSFKEKLSANKDTIYGYDYTFTNMEDGQRLFNLSSVTIKEDKPVFTVVKQVEGNDDFETVAFQEANPQVAIPSDEHGKIFIYVFADASDPDSVINYELEY